MAGARFVLCNVTGVFKAITLFKCLMNYYWQGPNKICTLHKFLFNDIH